MTGAVLRSLTFDELESALKRIHRTNDMLPPREDDKISERMSRGFAHGLYSAIQTNDYRPSPAVTVPVAKTIFTTRPAAVVSLRDRVVFEALVDRARLRISRALLSAECLVWPRADASLPDWQGFETAPLARGGGFILLADVAGFYESVSHPLMVTRLAAAGVAIDVAESIGEFLTTLMGTPRGLPQGLVTSDSLATAYLAQVDAGLSSAGLTFWRHGDDYRLHGATLAEVHRGAHVLEQLLRDSALLMNQRKTRSVDYATYSTWLADVHLATAEYQEELHRTRIQDTIDLPEEELISILEGIELDEDIQWSFFYWGRFDIEELKDALAPILVPSVVDVLEKMFVDCVSGSGASLEPELQHGRFGYSLRRLSASKSETPLRFAGQVLVDRPDETQDMAGYLIAMVDSHPQAVAAAAQYGFVHSPYVTDWQAGWILRVLSRCAEYVDDALVDRLEINVNSDAYGWLYRVEAARVLASLGRLTGECARNLTTKAPAPFASDLAGIVTLHEAELEWAPAFLEGMSKDPINAVVIAAIRSKATAA